jgi:hypothetical protein
LHSLSYMLTFKTLFIYTRMHWFWTNYTNMRDKIESRIRLKESWILSLFKISELFVLVSWLK